MKIFMFLLLIFSQANAFATENLNETGFLKAMPKKPKLVLNLVYDQFRADMLTRFSEKFLPAKQKDGKLGGFRYLMENGAYFPFAEYEVLQCMTCPGHAMILTGSYPYNNGIPLNESFDSSTGKMVYCAEDAEFGLSPRRLKGTTVGDELKLISKNSKVISLALKDRSAIMLGGHSADAAIWLNSDKMEWETSKYYDKRTDLTWLANWNKRVSLLKDADVQWKPIYTAATFNYKAKAQSGDALGFPLGVDLTNKIAIEILKQYKLGQGSSTDQLAISFSTHDISGHKYGPNSAETEELTIAEDHLLADFLNEVNKLVPGGLKNVVITLTADHGVASIDDFAKAKGIDAGKINQEDMLAKLNSELDKKFGKIDGGKWLIAYRSFNFYFAKEAAKKLKEKESDVYSFAKEWLSNQDGVAFVVTLLDYKNGILPPEMHSKQTTKSYIPGISGDILLIPRPGWYEASKNIAAHMTGYTYDRTVPMIFIGANFKPGVYAKPSKVVDLAPTLSFILGQIAPSLSEGRVLFESLKD